MDYLGWDDYIIITTVLVLSLGTGLFQTRRKTNRRTTSEYIKGNGNMAVLPVALSMFVSYQSGIMMIGVPAEVYLYGLQICMAFCGNFIGDLIGVYLFVPHLVRLQINSIFEYLEVRYNSRGIRLFGTILSIIFGINYMGTVLAMPAVTLKAVAGIDMWVSVVALMAVVLIYTLIGGFTAVIWTDVLQANLMVVGILAVLIKGTIANGGPHESWETFYNKDRLNFFLFDVDPTVRQSFWSLVIGSVITYLRNPFQQTSFLRIKATPKGKRMYLMAGAIGFVVNILAAMCGAIMFAYYYNKGCDPLISKQLNNANQLLPAMVLDIFQSIPCLPGLFLSALFSASLSTISSVLSGIMSVFWEDIVKPYTKPMSERRGIVITQLSGLLFGVLGIGIAFLVSNIEGPVVQIFLTTSACFSGAVTGIFVLGFLVPWADKLGAIVGGATSVLLVAWITIGKLTSSGTRQNFSLDPAPIDNCSTPVALLNSNISSSSLSHTNITIQDDASSNVHEPHGLDVLYSLSFRWLEPVGVITVLLIGSLVSFMTRQCIENQEVSPELIVSVNDSLCFCLPTNKRFHNGDEYQSPDDVTGIHIG